MKLLFRLLSCIVFLPLTLGCPQKRDSSEVIVAEEHQKIIEDSTILKINGVSFFASKDAILQENISPLNNIHEDYATIMPFGFIKNLDHPKIIYNHELQWFVYTDDGAKQY